MTTREFVQNMIGGDIDHEIPMTLADAIYDIECYREEGTELPEDLTPELFQETWNELIYEGCKINGVTVGTFRVNEGHYYDGWEGVNYRKWKTDDELKQMLREDLKTAGIKASIRFRRAGYLTALTVTISIKSSDILPFEEWSERGTRLYGRSWLPYYDDDGVYKEIHESEFFNLPDEQREELAPKILKTMYRFAVSHLSESGTVPDDDVLTDDAKERYHLVKAIVGSYNRDCSNSMIDYFDRDIYDRYTFKITDAAA